MASSVNLLIYSFGSVRSYVCSFIPPFVRSFIRSLVPSSRLIVPFVSFNRTFTPVVRSFGGSLFSSCVSFDSLFFSFAFFVRSHVLFSPSFVCSFIHMIKRSIPRSLKHYETIISVSSNQSYLALLRFTESSFRKDKTITSLELKIRTCLM